MIQMTQANETKRQPAITVQPQTVVDGQPREAAITEASRLELRTAGGQVLHADPMRIPEALHPVLILHGLKQKLIDAAAISRDPETGRSATIDDKWAAVTAVWERLLSGEWNAARGEGGGTGGLLFKALCRMQQTKTPEAIKSWLDGKTDKEKAALRLNPKVAAIIETIRAESAKAGDIDSDAMLDELGE
jgi:hypothetical protein